MITTTQVANRSFMQLLKITFSLRGGGATSSRTESYFHTESDSESESELQSESDSDLDSDSTLLGFGFGLAGV